MLDTDSMPLNFPLLPAPPADDDALIPEISSKYSMNIDYVLNYRFLEGATAWEVFAHAALVVGHVSLR